MPDQAEKLRELVGTKRGIRVVSVSSGKGGVGKSFFSVNLAVALSRIGIRTLVIDADFGLANVDVMLGVTSKYNLSHFLRGEKELSEIIQTGHHDVHLISGGSGVKDLLEMNEKQVETLLDGMTKLDMPIDLIIIDTGAGVNEIVLQMALSASEAIVITTTEPTSILDAYAFVKMLHKRNNTLPLHIVVNKYENIKEANRVLDGFLEFVGRNLGKNINPLGLIMYDQAVTHSIKRQVPIVVESKSGEVSTQIEQIARSLVDLPGENSSGGVFAKIFSRFNSIRNGHKNG